MTYRPSAGLLTSGIALLILGGVMSVFGVIQYSGANSFNQAGPQSIAIIGSLASLLGLALLLVGVYRLAANVDLAAQRLENVRA